MTLERIPKRFRTPGHELFFDGASIFFGDKKLYQRIARKAARTGEDIEDEFDYFVVASGDFGSDLSRAETRWLAGLIRAALK